MSWTGAALSGLLLLGASACGGEADARPQLYVVVDTDAPVVGQLAYRPELSPAAAVDLLRIDVSGETPLELAVPDEHDWPVSFGVAAPARGGTLTLRLTAFRASLAKREDLPGSSALVPRSEVAIDRVVRVRSPDSGVRDVKILLTMDCMGVTPSFTQSTSCIDAARPSAPMDQAPEPMDDGPHVGTWSGAVERPCGAASPADAICIPGGFSVLGDPDSVGLSVDVLDALPLRPARISPFHLDGTEFSVGRFRHLIADLGFVPPALPDQADPNDPFRTQCTWRGPSDASADDLPLNCVSKETAIAACALVHGRLPTDAEFSHAARGRGQGRTHVWGEEPPSCCRASIARFASTSSGSCGPPVVEPTGSHTGEDCDGIGDVSRDGVLDLAGSLGELVSDDLLPYSDPCWSGIGPLNDPRCDDPTVTEKEARGGSWTNGTLFTRAAIRYEASENMAFGFRCAYGDAP